MTKNDEEELRSIVRRFRKKVPNEDDFVKRLLNLKQALATERRHYADTGLAEGAAIETVKKLLNALAEVEEHFQKLCFKEPNFTQSTDNKMPKAVREAIAKRAKLLEALGDRNSLLENSEATIRSFPQVIDILKNAILDEAYGLIHGQQTQDKVQTVNVAIMAHYCHEAEIEISASASTKFHNLTKWLLGQSDPQKAIRKAKKLHERFLETRSGKL